MYLIAIGRRYFSARRGHFGGFGNRREATLFTLYDATVRAHSIVDARVVAA